MTIFFPVRLTVEVSFTKGCLAVRVCRRRNATHIKIFDRKEITKMELQVGVNKGSVVGSPQSDDGVERPVDGNVVFSATPDGIVHLELLPDGKSVDVVPVAMGTATLTASADADPGPGDSEIGSNSITITVSAAPNQEATHIVLLEGPVVPQ